MAAMTDDLDTALRDLGPIGAPDPADWSDVSALARRRGTRNRAGAAAVLAVTAVLAVVFAANSRSGTDLPVAADGPPAETGTLHAGDAWDAEPQPLPPSPLAPRRDAAGAWTGTELVITGGGAADGSVFADAAAYNPESSRWRPLPDSGLAPRAGHVAVWTGAEVVVWGGGRLDGNGDLLDGAAYNPSTDTWRPITAAPAGRYHGTAVVADGHVVVAAGVDGKSGSFPGAVLIYDIAGDTWQTVDAPGRVLDIASVGSRVVAVVDDPAEGTGWLFGIDPATGKSTGRVERPDLAGADTVGAAGDGDIAYVVVTTGDAVVVDGVDADLHVLRHWIAAGSGVSLAGPVEVAMAGERTTMAVQGRRLVVNADRRVFVVDVDTGEVRSSAQRTGMCGGTDAVTAVTGKTVLLWSGTACTTTSVTDTTGSSIQTAQDANPTATGTAVPLP